MSLKPTDFDAPARGVLVNWCMQRIQALRIQNDSKKLDSYDTAHVRGQIAELKHLLGQIDPRHPGDPRDWKPSSGNWTGE